MMKFLMRLKNICGREGIKHGLTGVYTHQRNNYITLYTQNFAVISPPLKIKKKSSLKGPSMFPLASWMLMPQRTTM